MTCKFLMFIICGIFLLNLVCAGEYNNFIDIANAFDGDGDFEARLNGLESQYGGAVIFMSVKTLGDMSVSQAYSTYAIDQQGINKRGSPEKNVFILFIEDRNHYYVHTAFDLTSEQAIEDLLVYNGRKGNMELGITEAIDYIEGIYQGIIKEGTSFYGDFGESVMCYDGYIYHGGKKTDYFIDENQGLFSSEKTRYYEIKKDEFPLNKVVGRVGPTGIISVNEEYKMEDKVLDDIDGKELAREWVLKEEKFRLKKATKIIHNDVIIYYGDMSSRYYIRELKDYYGTPYYQIWMTKTLARDVRIGSVRASDGVIFIDDEYWSTVGILAELNEKYSFNGCNIHSIVSNEGSVIA